MSKFFNQNCYFRCW